MNKLTHTASLNTTHYLQKPTMHAGMSRKPLAPYNPNSYRSRLPIATIVMPYKNSSQVVIGDRTSQNKKHFKTNNQLRYLKPDYAKKAVTNPGINARETQWIHKM